MVEQKPQEIPVIWIQTSCCTGCSVSVLNSVSPNIKNVLVDEVVPGKHVNLKFQATVMAGAGDIVIEALEQAQETEKGKYILVVEGAIPTARDGIFGGIGEKDEKMVTMTERVSSLAKDALAIISLGTCAAFGGIPAGEPNPTACKGVKEFLDMKGITTPVINVPGCPPHPDWFIGTVAHVLIFGLPNPEDLDDNLRPKMFYGKLIHENCPRRAYFDEGKFAQDFGDEGCLHELGCKGPVTYADCPTRQWNAGVNWCIGCGSPCIGCCEPGFPDVVAPMYEKLTDVPIPNIGEFWKKEGEE